MSVAQLFLFPKVRSPLLSESAIAFPMSNPKGRSPFLKLKYNLSD
ncbi:hypothetical protein QUB32_06980 [Microcoleus sp. AT8-A4]